MSPDQVLRRIRLTPYRPGAGPRFTLTVIDTGRSDARGRSILGYRLVQIDGRRRTLLFAGEDFTGSPLHAIDSDQTIAALLGFLTLRPGDTDREYFAGYTDVQMAYCQQYAEALSAHVDYRFVQDRYSRNQQ